LVPDGTTVTPREGQKPSIGPFYLLDFDVFRQYSRNQAQPMTADVICAEALEYNRAIYRLFQWSIADAYRDQMGVSRYVD